jgi:hypothetical protein
VTHQMQGARRLRLVHFGDRVSGTGRLR